MNTKTIMVVEGCLLDVSQRRLIVDGQPNHLTRTQYSILEYVVFNAGRIVTTADVIRYVWPSYPLSPREELYVYISGLRKLLAGKASIISVRGRGYLFEHLPR